MYTGSVNSELFGKFNELGAYATFQKPQSLNNLVEIIKKVPLSNTIQ